MARFPGTARLRARLVSLALVVACDNPAPPPLQPAHPPFSVEIDGKPLTASEPAWSSTTVQWSTGRATIGLFAGTWITMGEGVNAGNREGVSAHVRLDPYPILRAQPGTVFPIRSAVEVMNTDGEPAKTVLHPEEGHSPAVLMAQVVQAPGGRPGSSFFSQRVSGELRIDEASFTHVRGHLTLRAEISEDPGPDAFAGHARSLALDGDIAHDSHGQYPTSRGSLEVTHGDQRFTLNHSFAVGFWASERPTLGIEGFARLDGAREPDGSTWMRLDLMLPAASQRALKPGVYELDPSANDAPRKLVLLWHQEQITPAEQVWRGQVEVLENTGTLVVMKGTLKLDDFGEVVLDLKVPYHPEE